MLALAQQTADQHLAQSQGRGRAAASARPQANAGRTVADANDKLHPPARRRRGPRQAARRGEHGPRQPDRPGRRAARRHHHLPVRAAQGRARAAGRGAAHLRARVPHPAQELPRVAAARPRRQRQGRARARRAASTPTRSRANPARPAGSSGVMAARDGLRSVRAAAGARRTRHARPLREVSDDGADRAAARRGREPGARPRRWRARSGWSSRWSPACSPPPRSCRSCAPSASRAAPEAGAKPAGAGRRGVEPSDDVRVVGGRRRRRPVRRPASASSRRPAAAAAASGAATTSESRRDHGRVRHGRGRRARDAEVWVVDGQPEYHRAGCEQLAGRAAEPIPLSPGARGRLQRLCDLRAAEPGRGRPRQRAGPRARGRRRR